MRTKVYHGRQAQQRDEADAAAHGWRVVSRASEPAGYRVTFEFGSGWAGTPTPRRRRRGLRKATWLIVFWNVGFVLLWLAIVPWTHATLDGVDDETLTLVRQAALSLGLAFVWFIGLLVASLIWFMSRPRA